MIELKLCKQEDKARLAHLCQFYHYDLDANSALANVAYSNGYYKQMAYFENYWLEENRFPYLIYHHDELVGFALVHDITVNPEADWKLAEFFIMAPFRREGVASYILPHLFEKHQGRWEISVLKDNKPAMQFWSKFLENHQVLKHETHPNYWFFELLIKK
jgi:predicted acetyltransferase